MEEQNKRVYTKHLASEMAKNLMEKEFIALDESTKVSDGFKAVKQKADKAKDLHAIYVTWNKQLVGVMSLRELMAADENAALRSIMNSKVKSVPEDMDQEEVANLIQDNHISSVPVVNEERHVVGVITINQAMDIMRDEATEDIYKSAGMNISKPAKGIEAQQAKEKSRSSILIEGSLPAIWKIRLPILLLTLVSGFFAGFILEGFEEVLESITVIAFFIPLIMDIGGDVGGQSTTMFARGFVLGHINPKRYVFHLFKEAGVGFCIGTLVGFLSFIASYVWLGNFGLSLALSTAIVVTCTVAAFLGFAVSIVLMKIGADQASGTGPIITAIKDITGIVIYFVTVTAFVDLTHYL